LVNGGKGGRGRGERGAPPCRVHLVDESDFRTQSDLHPTKEHPHGFCRRKKGGEEEKKKQIQSSMEVISKVPGPTYNKKKRGGGGGNRIRLVTACHVIEFPGFFQGGKGEKRKKRGGEGGGKKTLAGGGRED